MRGKILVAVLAAAYGTAALACSSADPDVGRNISERDEAADDGDGGRAGPDDAAFAGTGPYEVGITTLHLPDRKVEVFYPAPAGSNAGRPRATFDIRGGFNADTFARLIPDTVVIPVEVDGYRELPVSGDGPFPVVLLSHGFSGWRTVNSVLATKIASWGFIVASADHIERNLQAVFLTFGRASPTGNGDYGAATMAAALDLVVAEAEPGGVLAGAVDAEKVAAVGHSAGGAASLALAATDDRVDTVVSWAASGPAVVGDKPVMIIATEGDVVTANLEADVELLTGPYRVVTLLGSGHSVFIDICPGLTTPDGVIGRARAAGIPLPDGVISLVLDGCEPGDVDVSDAWPTIAHFTVAQVRDVFGIGKAGTGLGDGVVDNLPMDVSYDDHS